MWEGGGVGGCWGCAALDLFVLQSGNIEHRELGALGIRILFWG